MRAKAGCVSTQINMTSQQLMLFGLKLGSQAVYYSFYDKFGTREGEMFDYFAFKARHATPIGQIRRLK
jgi:hypothetical protein